MKLTSAEIRLVVSDARKRGFDAGLRDVSFAILSNYMEEPAYAYRAIFGDNPEVSYQDYMHAGKTVFIRDTMSVYLDDDEEDVGLKAPDDEKKTEERSMSFDEIKAGLEEDLKSLIALRDQVDDDGKSMLEPKEMATVVGRIADIRTKLVERFGSSEKKEEQRVIVLQKFNDICPYCGHEVAIDPSHDKLF